MLLLSSGCQTTYYAAMEKLGKDKRDLLRSSLEEAKEEQEDASTQFRDALFELKELYGFSGGDLEERYESFKANYEQSKDKAERFKNRADTVDRIGSDLFREWESELLEISNQRLRNSSEDKLAVSKRKHRQIVGALRSAEKNMDEVLVKMNDYVLFLKHNLNAQAIGSLKDEAIRLESDIVSLISDINRSVLEIQTYLNDLEEAPAL